jgi:hypothetical protein
MSEIRHSVFRNSFVFNTLNKIFYADPQPLAADVACYFLVI